MRRFVYITLAVIAAFVVSPHAPAQSQKSAPKGEWEKTLEAAKKEGKVVVSLPASAELRKMTEETFPKRFGIEAELITSRGGAIVRRIADEWKAGVHYFDIHIGGSSSAVSGLLAEGVLDPIEPFLILPEVKEPKNWWGGHMYADRAGRYIYTFQAYMTEGIWYNTTLMKPEEIRSYDDLLDPKWKGKIGFLDPRTPGAGDSTWSYLWKVKGEEYLKRLVGQKLHISRDQRLLADNLAKGKLTVVIGLTHYSFLPFLKAGIPLKPLPTPKEGDYGTGGSGNLTIMKNPPHPNATKLFVNWLLGKEGQEFFMKAMGQGTRRLDMDTKWLKELGIVAAKDELTVQQYMESENQSEEKLETVRKPASEIARKLLD